MNLFLSSKTVEISEHKTYIELLNRVCYYDAPNMNGAMLPFEDTTLEKAQTLVGMPVVAKYTVDAQGKPTFKGHEVSLDSNGEIVFGTTPIGVHTEAYIENDVAELPDGTTTTLPCLFAKMKIWSRNKRAIAAIQRLYSEDNLRNSWEISVSQYEFKDGIKKITDYVFEGNALIGVEPAYKSAKVLSLSAKEQELLVAEALSQDLIELSDGDLEGNEVETMDENTNIEIPQDTPIVDVADVEAPDVAEDIPAEPEVPQEEPIIENAELTMRDLRDRIEEAVYNFADRYLDVAFIFPEAHKCWAHHWEDKETDIYEVTYAVENDEVTILDMVQVTLMVELRQINSTFDEQNSALIEAQKQINDLSAQIAELAPFKEAAEQAALEKAEQERQEAIAELRAFAEDSGVLTSDELAEGEIAEMIQTLKAVELKVLIAERIVQKTKKKSAPETAAAKKIVKPRLALDEAEVAEKPGKVLMSWLNK